MSNQPNPCNCQKCEYAHEMPPAIPLIGDKAPKFTASTTNGPINFPDDFAGKWIVFFSHPSDFTPVCTSEFIEFQRQLAEFDELNTKLIGLSIGALSSHLAWFNAIDNLKNGINITFPLIDDITMRIAKMYGMLQPNASNTSAVRAVFIIDPAGIVQAILYYPAILGRNINEIKRMIIGFQTANAFGVATPANWVPGDDVLSPAPTNATAMRQHNNKTPWFLTYKRLTADDIYSKIRKQKPGKK